jgi:hypothetical protein
VIHKEVSKAKGCQCRELSLTPVLKI